MSPASLAAVFSAVRGGCFEVFRQPTLSGGFVNKLSWPNHMQTIFTLLQADLPMPVHYRLLALSGV